MNIYAFSALKSDAARSRLVPMLEAEWKRKGSTAKSKTISAAICALDLVIDSDVRQARKDGELLFCWHGTKATEVAA
jgi:hypothetical protein